MDKFDDEKLFVKDINSLKFDIIKDLTDNIEVRDQGNVKKKLVLLYINIITYLLVSLIYHIDNMK